MQTLEQIIKKHQQAFDAVIAGSEINEQFYSELYEHFVDSGEMPYGVMKARTGDPRQWIENQLAPCLRAKLLQKENNDVERFDR